jgi:hypothetical protein
VWARSDVATRPGAPIALLMIENCGMCLVVKPSNQGCRPDPDALERRRLRCRLQAVPAPPARPVCAVGRRLSAPSDDGPTIAAVSDREVAAMTEMTEAHELLLIEEADAWFEYLEATRGQTALRYTEIEPWAWARLRQRLRAIKTRRAKLRPAAA